MIGARESDRRQFETARLRRREVLPPSFFPGLRGRTAGSGERRLAAAILEDAVRSFRKTFPARDYGAWRLHWETDAWLNGRAPDHLFCFKNVCSILRVEPESVRSALYGWRQRQIAKSIRQARALRSIVTPPSIPRGSEGRAVPASRTWGKTSLSATA